MFKEEERNQERAKTLSYTFAGPSVNSFVYLDIMCEDLTLLNTENYLVRV